MTSYTVTASSTAPNSQGFLFRVKVLTGATEAGGASVAQQFSTAAGEASLTPAGTNSYIEWATEYGNEGAFTQAASNTLDDNFDDSGIGCQYGTGFYSGTVTSGTPVTVGTSAPANQSPTLAAYEILASGGSTPSLDASSPAVVQNDANPATGTTASFSPPPGSVLVVAIAVSDNTTSEPVPLAVSSTPALTWTQRAIAIPSGNATAFSQSAVFTATVPAGAPAAPVPGARQQYAPGWHPGRGLPGMPGGTPFDAVPEPSFSLAPMPYNVCNGTAAAGTTTLAVPVGTGINSPQGTTAGDLVYIAAGNAGGDTVSSVSDGKNTYAQVVPAGASSQRVEIWASLTTQALIPGADTITITWSLPAGGKFMIARGCTGIASATADQVSAGGSTSTAASSGSTATLSQAAELVTGAIQDAAAGGSPSKLSFSPPGQTVVNGPFLTVFDEIVSSTAAQTASGTIASTVWAAAIATFKFGAPLVTAPSGVAAGGALTAAGSKADSGPAGVAGEGTLASTGFKAATGASGIAGTGAVTGTGSKGGTGPGTVAGTAAVTSTGSKTASAAGAIGGEGGRVSPGAKAARGPGAVSGAGSVTALSATVFPSAVAAAAEITAAGAKNAIGASRIGASGAASAVASRASAGPSALSGQAALAGAGDKATAGATRISGATALAAPGRKAATGAAAVTATGLLAGTGVAAITTVPFPVISITPASPVTVTISGDVPGIAVTPASPVRVTITRLD